jgi:hypothetical protein
MASQPVISEDIMNIHTRIRGHRKTAALGAVLLLTAIGIAAPLHYSNEVMADNPIGYWRFSEAAGTAAADSSGNGNNGTYSGGVTLGQPGLPPAVPGDTAALFDGSSGRVVVPNSASLNPASITMEAKVRWDGPTGEIQQRILEKESFAGTTQYGLSIMPNAHVHVELRMRVPGSPNVILADSTNPIARGAETHIAATYNGLEIRIYLNGILDTTKSVNTTPVAIDTKWPHTPPDDPEVALVLGDRQSVIPPDTRHRTFNGLIDEIALYDHALPGDRILAHYRSQFEAKNYEYAVKFVCGVPNNPVVAPGTYFTAINVHNPQAGTVAFKTKVAVALPSTSPGPEVKQLPEGPLGEITRFIPGRLGPDQAFEIDCPEILKIAKPRERFLKGFVVLEVPEEFDIVAVYTAAGATGRVETMEIERVPARVQSAAAGKQGLVGTR